MGSARPEVHRLNLQPALVFQPKTWTPFHIKYLWSCWITWAEAAPIAAWLWTPRGLRGEEGGSVLTTAVTAGIYSAQRVCVLWEKRRMVIVVIFIPFCFSASCQTQESTHRQKRAHLSANRGCLFKMRIHSEFWQLSVWGCLLWGWGKGHETCCLLSPREKPTGCF